MTTRLGLHTLLLLAIVAASTVMLVAPECFGARANAAAPALASMPAIGHA